MHSPTTSLLLTLSKSTSKPPKQEGDVHCCRSLVSLRKKSKLFFFFLDSRPSKWLCCVLWRVKFCLISLDSSLEFIQVLVGPIGECPGVGQLKDLSKQACWYCWQPVLQLKYFVKEALPKPFRLSLCHMTSGNKMAAMQARLWHAVVD